jgi:hypothetical protein
MELVIENIIYIYIYNFWLKSVFGPHAVNEGFLTP